MKIYIASNSPRRYALLKQISVDFEVINIEIDESVKKNEMPLDYVHRIATEKANAGKQLAKNNFPILAADTAVVLDNFILGKAENKKDATYMLNELSGRTHDVLSAVTVIGKKEITKVKVSKVTFKTLSDDDISKYCDTDEPIGKAGGYAIQGKGAALIEKLEGSYSGVMGLPLEETCQLLTDCT